MLLALSVAVVGPLAYAGAGPEDNVCRQYDGDCGSDDANNCNGRVAVCYSWYSDGSSGRCYYDGHFFNGDSGIDFTCDTCDT